MFNVLIPMGGEGSRFGYKFKPLIKLDDRTFIEHVLDPFIKKDLQINKYFFIITREQENAYNATELFYKTLSKDFMSKLEILIIENQTEGPYQTIISAILKNDIENVFICDCDHKINIDPMIEMISTQDIDIIIPTWKINENEQQNWGKIILENDNIVGFYEKEILSIEPGQQMRGLIGCYYFKTTKVFNRKIKHINFSDYFKEKNSLKMKTCDIKEAYFFGTPEMVKAYIETQRRFENIICDVDGVLIYHSPNSNANPEDNYLIKDCANKILEWRSQNKKIILMTARSKSTRNEFIKLLRSKKIVWDELIMGVNPGTRYVINDIKPTHIFTKQAIEINRVRDEGIDDIDCNEHKNNDIKIIKKFKGGSFSNTYLIKKDDILIVRKHILKNKKTMEHYFRLKRQCDDLRRFYYYDNQISPKILFENDNNFDYYYDMEYLYEYEQLDNYDTYSQKYVVSNLLKKMNENIYCYKKSLSKKEQDQFMDKFFEEKINLKLLKFENESSIMNYLIKNEEVTINNKNYFGLKAVISKLNVNSYSPNFICPIHGDLNFENILYNQTKNDVKIIDMEGSRYVDTPLFDLGKLFQSLVSRYESWSKIENVIMNKDINNLTCISEFFYYDDYAIKDIIETFKKILLTDDAIFIKKAGIFYMAMYFIRFVPFRLLVSKEHGDYALIMATVWLNKIL
jgi:molybdopterin-guanine dinucleotide biosynthesis protein A